MTTETILTDDDLRDQKINLGVIAPDDFFNRVARAIEQSVLQSEQVQEWKRDADRLDWLAGPTPEMVEAAEDAYMTFGDMELAIRMAVLAAPAVQGEPVAYAVFADNGNIRIWSADPIQAETLRLEYGDQVRPLYAAPKPAAQQPDVTQLAEALEDISGTHHHSASAGEYFAKVARAALANYRKQGGEA